MNIIRNYCTKSDCYKAGKKITVKGLMIHSVGCPQPKAQPFINNWNKSGANALAHAIIEPNGKVYQLLPWERRGWHAGGSANDYYIGVEMTEPDTIKYTGGSVWSEISDGKNTKKHVLATYETAVELFAKLCKTYKLNPTKDGIIISHSEGYKRGIATNHGDVEHIWKKYGLTMAQFRKDIKKKMDKDGTTTVNKTSTEKKVKVSISNLCIRKGPGTNYGKTGKYTGKGTFTITQTKSGTGSKKGWGELKTGDGWISLDYAKEV
jgi:N-acetylmuramoyl-L-alanine amidase CwlA